MAVRRGKKGLAGMIHVNEQLEPVSFDTKVRQKGLKYLADHGIDSAKPLPPKTVISTCWRDCLDELYTLYNGTCAYLAVHFERVTGAGSVDHFIAKSPMPIGRDCFDVCLRCSRK